MSYRLRMHSEIRNWLTELRDAEPELARPVGEAVLAMLDAGDTLGPPLAVPLESVFRSPEDPREALDRSYQYQLETLTEVRRSVADVATSRKRLELTASMLEQQIAKLASQHALLDVDEDLADEARRHEAAAAEHLCEVRRQLDKLTREEDRLTTASQRLQAQVEAFRVQKETIKATYTAAEGSQRVHEAFVRMGVDASDLEVTYTETDVASAFATAATADEEIRDLARPYLHRPGATDEDDILPPPSLMELRPGAPDDVRVGLLFVVESPDTAVLLGWVEDPGGPPEDYRDVLRIVTGRLATAQQAGPSTDEASFLSYDADSFLDEFFPGEGTEVEIGAATLVARNRAHTLAEARQRMNLTQAQVADRMNVRQERVSAIERGEPGATEVRTLAAYVRALGGRLEIVADLSGERVVLR